MCDQFLTSKTIDRDSRIIHNEWNCMELLYSHTFALKYGTVWDCCIHIHLQRHGCMPSLLEFFCNYTKCCAMLSIKAYIGKNKIISVKKVPPVGIELRTSCGLL